MAKQLSLKSPLLFLCAPRLRERRSRAARCVRVRGTCAICGFLSLGAGAAVAPTATRRLSARTRVPLFLLRRSHQHGATCVTHLMISQPSLRLFPDLARVATCRLPGTRTIRRMMSEHVWMQTCSAAKSPHPWMQMGALPPAKPAAPSTLEVAPYCYLGKRSSRAVLCSLLVRSSSWLPPGGPSPVSHLLRG